MARAEDRGFKTHMAKTLHVKPQAVQRYFKKDDKTVPSLDQADKIAEAIGKPLADLIKPPSAPQLQEPAPKPGEQAPSLLLIEGEGDTLRQLLAILPALKENRLKTLLHAARSGLRDQIQKLDGGV